MRRCVGVFPYLVGVCLVLSMTSLFFTTPTGSQKRHSTRMSHDSSLPWEDRPGHFENDKGIVSYEHEGEFESIKTSARNKDSRSLVSDHTQFHSPVQTSRQQAIQHFCNTHRNHSNHTGSDHMTQEISRWSSLSPEVRRVVAQRILVNDDHSILYCPVPLISTGPWLKVMYYIGEGSHLHDITMVTSRDIQNKKNFVYLSSYSLEEQEMRLRSYHSFMVARHPFSRLAAAYKMKFETWNGFFYDKYARSIIDKYRTHDSYNYKNVNRSKISFNEFIQFLSDQQSMQDMNEHWQPLELLCRPCEVHYGMILHYESLKKESSELLKMAKITHSVGELPWDAWDYVTMDRVRELLRTVSPARIGRLVEQYSSDFDLFSYASLET